MQTLIYQQFQQHIKAGDKASARKLISQYLKDNPNDADGWYLAATVAGKEQRVNLLNKALAVDPFHEKSHQALAQLQNATSVQTSNPKDKPYLIRYALLGGFIIVMLVCVWVGMQNLNKSEFYSLPFDEQIQELKKYLYNPFIPSTVVTNDKTSSLQSPYPYDPSRGFSTGWTRGDHVLYVQGMVRGMTDFMIGADSSNQQPSLNEGDREWVLVSIVAECLSSTYCRGFSPADFVLIDRQNGTVYQLPTDLGVFGIDEIDLLYLRGIISDNLSRGFVGFIIPEDTPARDLILVYDPYDLATIRRAKPDDSLAWHEWVNYIDSDGSSYFELANIAD